MADPALLVAGAGGSLGRLIVAAAGPENVRALIRRERGRAALQQAGAEVRVADALRPESLRGVCDGVHTVISTVGASVDPSPLVGWRPYTRVDAPANLALLAEAQCAGVRRFIYVSLINGEQDRALNYAEGHERVVDALRSSGLDGIVFRPTGFFSAMTAFVDLARRGVVPVFGDGACRTNPVDERDLAAAIVQAAAEPGAGFREVPMGGPEVFTRNRIAEMAFEALGKRPRLLHVPAGAARAGAHILRLVNPRAGHFTLFAAHVMTHDCLAPPVGTSRLQDAFSRHAAAHR